MGAIAGTPVPTILPDEKPPGNSAVRVGREIKNGQYTADSKGGVPVGTHKVEILGYQADPNIEPVPEDVPGVEGGTPGEQYIPEKYNKQTELKLSIESGSGKITKDFQLKE